MQLNNSTKPGDAPELYPATDRELIAQLCAYRGKSASLSTIAHAYREGLGISDQADRERFETLTTSQGSARAEVMHRAARELAATIAQLREEGGKS
jgi:hypothetical protein